MLQFGCPENRGVDLETSVLQTTDNILHTVSVAGERQVGAESIFSAYWLTLRLKRKEQIAPRHQDPRQLVKRLAEPIRRCIDDRVPADSTSEPFRFDGKCIKSALLELNVRMCGASDAEHCLGHVHADDVETMIRHECRHSAWSAADISNPTDGLSLDQLNEVHEQRPVTGEFCRRTEVSTHELDVCPRRYVKDVSGGRYMVFTRHTSKLRDFHSSVLPAMDGCSAPERWVLDVIGKTSHRYSSHFWNGRKVLPLVQ